MEAINLQLTNYKEKDGLVLLFNQDGVYTITLDMSTNPNTVLIEK